MWQRPQGGAPFIEISVSFSSSMAPAPLFGPPAASCARRSALRKASAMPDAISAFSRDCDERAGRRRVPVTEDRNLYEDVASDARQRARDPSGGPPVGRA